MQHVFHKCKNADCQVCEGGLVWCTICGGFEGSLLTYCPGYSLNENALNECYHGKVIDITHVRRMIEHGARIINGKLVWNRR